MFLHSLKIDNRDNANNLAYLGIMEDGTYYVQDAPKNIRFQVTSEDNSLYKITNSNGEEVNSKIVVNNGKKFILNGYWKVYSNAETTKDLFNKFDEATEMMIRRLLKGDCIKSRISKKVA